MMDCRQVKQLLPLWVGQDLPDTATTTDVAKHLEHCHDCQKLRVELQASLEVLQGSSAQTLSIDLNRRSVWPSLISRISNWEQQHRRERFNGWIPASVMALAAALMIAVSLPSIRDELFSNDAQSASTEDLFASDTLLQANPEFDSNSPAKQTQLKNRTAIGTPVIYRPDQW